ncbi:MAG: hypothetical protein WCD06_04280, partial [Candidatus Sulfotelmatobacter sp.]
PDRGKEILLKIDVMLSPERNLITCQEGNEPVYDTGIGTFSMPAHSSTIQTPQREVSRSIVARS